MVPAIGYGIRKENRLILDEPAINGVEITFENADEPLRVDRFVGWRDFDYVSLHGLEMSIASADLVPRSYLEAMQEIVEENGVVAVSDHLGFTRDTVHKVGMGHFAPPPFSHAALGAVCRNVEHVQKFFDGLPFYLENIAYMFRFKGEMNEADFLSKVLSRTGCGWLLDVTNVYANAQNHGYDAYDFIRQVVPVAGRMQMHLAGGYFDHEANAYIDSHSEPIPEKVWNLYRFALQLGHGKVDAVFIERDDNFPTEDGWRSEVQHAREIAEAVSAGTLSGAES